ncbi:MAG: DUF192 domain-containing protein [Candidatus Hydrothermarchaeales archaeon]
MKYEVHNTSRANLICTCSVADAFFSRLKGLMFKSSLPRDEGLLIEFSPLSRSRSIHGFFMRFPIDLIFINEDLKVVEIETLYPWRYYSPRKGCKWVLEVNKGVAKEKEIEIGDELEFKSIP